MTEFAQTLVWDRVQKKDDFWDKLYENILTDIQQNLAIYKKFSKFAFNGSKLMIIGDVLNNGMSLTQLYNIIHMNCQNIRGIIFKDTGRIRGVAFSDLMTQLFLIPQIDSIAFLSSVLDESSLFELQYLLIQKKLKFLVLNESYFLSSEIQELIETNPSSPIQLNHSRFVVIDVDSKKSYEFCPYSFCMDEALKKEDSELLDSERMYVFQKHYPKQIQDEISFFHSRNLSIISENNTEKTLFKHWDLLQKSETEQRAIFNQEELTKKIETILQEDNLDILCYGIVKKLISLVSESETQKNFEEQLLLCKSFKVLIQIAPEEVAAKITYNSLSHLKLAHAYTMGFTRIKTMTNDYIVNSSNLYENLHDEKTVQKRQRQNGSIILQQTLTGKEKDEKSNKMFLDKARSVLDLSKMIQIRFVGIKPTDGTYQFLNELLKECSNLKFLSLVNCQLSDTTLVGVDLSSINSKLSELDISHNSSITDGSFLNAIFKKCRKLKVINFLNNQMTPEKANSIDFTLISPSLESFDLSFNQITKADILNRIFQGAKRLKILNLLSSGVTSEVIRETNFITSLEEVNLNYNNDLPFIDIIETLGKLENSKLKKLEAFSINFPETHEVEQFGQYKIVGSLPGFAKLKDLQIQKNRISYELYLQLFFNNSPLLNEFTFNEGFLSTLTGTGIESLAPQLISLQLGYQSALYDTSSISQLLKVAVNLTKFGFTYSSICSSSRMDNIIEEDIPSSIEELNFEGNYQGNEFEFINKFFRRCDKLKKFDLSSCELDVYKLASVDFSLISEDLEEVLFNKNPNLTSFEFINVILKKAQNLKILSLTGFEIKDGAKEINFGLLGKSFQQLIFDQNCEYVGKFIEGSEEEEKNSEELNYFNFDFTDWLMKKQNIAICIYDYEQENMLNVMNQGTINYFDTFENHNIYQKNLTLTQWEKKKTIIATNVEEKKEDGVLDVDSKNQSKKKGKKNKKNKEKQQIEKKEVKHSNYTNIWYFYSFFSSFGQMQIGKDIISVQQIMKNIKMVEFQNVYDDEEYVIMYILASQMTRRVEAKAISQVKKIRERNSLSTEDIIQIELPQVFDKNQFIQMIEEIVLSGQQHTNLRFLNLFFDKCLLLKILDLSNMKLTGQMVETIILKPLPSLEEANFSQNNFESTNLANFIDQVMKNAQNLQKLNLSRMEINDSTPIPLEFGQFCSENLEHLDISKNKKFPLEPQLLNFLNRAQKLKKLVANAIGLTEDSPSLFDNVSTFLEEIDLSNNNLVGNKIIVDTIICRCQQLKVLNLMKCKLTSSSIEQLSYYCISEQLEKLNLSGNEIKNSFYFLQQIVSRSPGFLKIDVSNQQLQIYCTPQVGYISSNQIEEISCGENPFYYDYKFVADIISTSENFKKLIFKKDCLHSVIVDSLNFPLIASKIQELDISNQEYITNVQPLSYLKDSQNFKSFTASSSVIDEKFFFDIKATESFQNITKLELDGCKYILSFKFLDDIFKIAQKLEILNLSNMIITQISLNQINFKNTPRSLQQFYFSGINMPSSFSFLTDLFEASQESLRILSLSNCELDLEKLSQVDFAKASKFIASIDLQDNKKLTSIDFLRPLFKKENYVMNQLKISLGNFEILQFLALHRNQIKVITYPRKIVTLQYFTQKNYKLQINLIELIRFLEDKTSSQLHKSQILYNGTNNVSQLFRNLIKTLISFTADGKSTTMVEHFIFLLLSEQNMPKSVSNSLEVLPFCILSPYSLFQQPNEIIQTLLNTTIEANSSDSDSRMFNPDTFHVSMFDMNILKGKKYPFVFGYSKFFLKDFSSFYSQNLNQNITDIDFIININIQLAAQKAERAFLPLRLNLNEKVLQSRRMNEFEALFLINSVPPAIITLKGLSIQFIKSWYAINFSAPLSVVTFMEVDYDKIENTSFANFFTLRSFKMYIANFEAKTFKSSIKKTIGQIGYSFFNAFSSQPKAYRFDHTVIHLENKIKEQMNIGRHSYLRALYPIYLFICIFGVFFFSLREGKQCGSAVPNTSYLTYGIFGIVTFLLEAVMFEMILRYVSHLIPDIKPDCRVNFPNPLINKVKIAIMDITWINRWYVNYTMTFLNSQLARFDFFTNMGFLYQTYACDQNLLFLLTLISLSIVNLSRFAFFIMTFFGDSTYNRLITGSIDRIYQISSFLEFQSVAELLDVISPTNSVVLFGRMFNQRIFQNFIRIIFQDMPLIIIKTAFLISSQGTQSSPIYPIISSSLMFLGSMSKFLAIMPTRLGQEDFNELCEIKKQRILPNYLKNLEQIESTTSQKSLVEEYKILKSTQYFTDVEKEFNTPVANIFEKIAIIRKLRKFLPNGDTLKILFGNSRIVDVPDQLQSQNEIKFQAPKMLESREKQNSHVSSQTNFFPPEQISDQEKNQLIQPQQQQLEKQDQSQDSLDRHIEDIIKQPDSSLSIKQQNQQVTEENTLLQK